VREPSCPEDHPEPDDHLLDRRSILRKAVVGVVGSGSSQAAPPLPPANFLRRRSPSSLNIQARQCLLKAGEGIGPEGSQFASPGAA
jgi:hypothetical protein